MKNKTIKQPTTLSLLIEALDAALPHQNPKRRDSCLCCGWHEESGGTKEALALFNKVQIAFEAHFKRRIRSKNSELEILKEEIRKEFNMHDPKEQIYFTDKGIIRGNKFTVDFEW